MTDERAAKGQEGLVDVGASFVAHTQTAKAVEPGKGAFDHPTVAAQAGRTVLSTTGDAWSDPTGS